MYVVSAFASYLFLRYCFYMLIQNFRRKNRRLKCSTISEWLSPFQCFFLEFLKFLDINWKITNLLDVVHWFLFFQWMRSTWSIILHKVSQVILLPSISSVYWRFLWTLHWLQLLLYFFHLFFLFSLLFAFHIYLNPRSHFFDLLIRRIIIWWWRSLELIIRGSWWVILKKCWPSKPARKWLELYSFTPFQRGILHLKCIYFSIVVS